MFRLNDLHLCDYGLLESNFTQLPLINAFIIEYQKKQTQFESVAAFKDKLHTL